MEWEQYQKHKPFAGEKKPSMLRRRIGHDYSARCIYLITITVEGRHQLLGRLVGDADAPIDSDDAPRVELTPLGEKVKERWMATEQLYPQIKVIGLQIMPDHLHGILFVKEQLDCHLGQVIKGFKTGCNKAYREMGLAVPSAIVPSAATGSQQRKQEKRDRSLDDREHGQLWALGFNDHILSGRGELANWKRYLQDNPRRLAIKKAYPDYFRVRFDLQVALHTYAAIGNRFLLQYPHKIQVQLSRSLSEGQIKEKVEGYLALAREGAILVSPAISKGEQAVMRAVMNAHLPLIFLTPWGFNAFSKPGHQYYEACAEGKLLLLAPWPHQNERIALTRQMCLDLNSMTKEICEWKQK
ncbi:MAG: hypothetical protein IJV44_11815 [Prevotella sp.]|nr:hypothetical protein [Prevotella sp.]